MRLLTLIRRRYPYTALVVLIGLAEVALLLIHPMRKIGAALLLAFAYVAICQLYVAVNQFLRRR